MLLESRNAVIYGGGGAIGGAVARAFAREGATVHLVGRTATTLEAVASEIAAGGGRAETWVADALDEEAVERHADAVVERFGSLDISFNLVAMNDVQGTPLVDMAVADLMSPVVTAVTAQFVTARAAARRMTRQRSGVILMFGGDGPPSTTYNFGGLQVAFSAVEALRRNLAAELGPHGIRVVTLRTSGIAETIPVGFEGRDEIVAGIDASTMLGRAATLDDVGNAAVFAASDWARSVTATALNISAGSMVD